MKEIIGPIISGIFSLAGIWLGYYLADRRDLRKKRQGLQEARPATPERQGETTGTPSRVRPSPRVRASGEPEEVVFLRTPSWWLLSAGIVALSIAAALFSQWIIDYGLGVFNVTRPDITWSWIALGLAGLAWGLAYVIAGTAEAEDSLECLFVLVAPYEGLFDPLAPGDVLRALLSALPINFLISWGAAIGLASFAATHFGADFAGVVYLTFTALVFIGIAWFLYEES